MTNKEIQYKALLREYDEKQNRATHTQKLRQQEIYKAIPEIESIDQKLASTGISLIRQMLSSPKDIDSNAFKENSKELQLTKKMLLVEYGYPKDYLEPPYECTKCKDTGFIGDKKCDCFTKNLIALSYEQSNLQNILQFENFGNFSFEFYSPEVPQGAKRSPRKNMQNIYQASIEFIEDFDRKADNMLFYGPAGLGKTFLCSCIAKELLDEGYSVLYLSAMNLFSLFNKARFNRDDLSASERTILDTLSTVDLLIIDDLGTENETSLTGPDFFDTINNRYLNQKSTIISTNLEGKDWKNIYSDRIISRIWGNYTTFRFFGDDIRLTKKYGNRAHRV